MKPVLWHRHTGAEEAAPGLACASALLDFKAAGPGPVMENIDMWVKHSVLYDKTHSSISFKNHKKYLILVFTQLQQWFINQHTCVYCFFAVFPLCSCISNSIQFSLLWTLGGFCNKNLFFPFLSNPFFFFLSGNFHCNQTLPLEWNKISDAQTCFYPS